MVDVPPGTFPTTMGERDRRIYPLGREILVDANAVQRSPAGAAVPHAVAAPRRTVRAEPDQVEPVLDAARTRRASRAGRASGRASPRGRPAPHVPHRAAVRADEVMVVPGQLLRQLEAPELLLGDHAPHDARLLERPRGCGTPSSASVAGAARICGIERGSPASPSRRDEVAPLRRVSLAHAAQPRLDRRVELGASCRALARGGAGAIGAPRLATAKTAAATSTIAPLSPGRPPARPRAPTTRWPRRSPPRAAPSAERPRRAAAPLATGSTISAAISRIPTTRIAATTTAAVSTGEHVVHECRRAAPRPAPSPRPSRRRTARGAATRSRPRRPPPDHEDHGHARTGRR